jgi:hypothetical protein
LLQFLCPSGHKVHCSEDRAGQAAKCPRCGVRFRIPTLEEVHSLDTSSAAEGSSVRVGSASISLHQASAVALGPALADQVGQIEFLCPNDHLLHGPTELQGQPGECPQCGSRFRVPTYADQPPPAVDDVAALHGSSEVPTVPDTEADQTSPSSWKRESTATVGSSLESASTAALREHPTARLMARLWSCREQGATIEIRCGEGQCLAPDQLVPSLTTATHGVFAVAEPNGTFTVTAVAWGEIRVVVARGVRQLPEAMES